MVDLIDIIRTTAFIICIAIFMYLVIDNLFYFLNKRR